VYAPTQIIALLLSLTRKAFGAVIRSRRPVRVPDNKRLLVTAYRAYVTKAMQALAPCISLLQKLQPVSDTG